MRVVVKRPGKPAEVGEIGTDLASAQEFVGGYIEALRLEKDIFLVVNEEGRLCGLKPNVTVGMLVLVGPLFVCKQRGDEFVGLDEDEARHYCEMMTAAGVPLKELN